MKIYFIAALGISQHGLIKLCLENKKELFSYFKFTGDSLQISGSDISESREERRELKKTNIIIHTGHYVKNIKNFNPDIIVINSAINNENPELIWARQNNKIILERAELLGLISSFYNKVIAVSGTHGKTTTTSILNSVFKTIEPTIHCGGHIVLRAPKATIIGRRNLFITEACEYRENFLNIKPDICVVLNISKDHLDYYKNTKHIQNAFFKFANNTKPGGILLYNKDDVLSKVFNNHQKPKFSFGTNKKKNPDFLISNIKKQRFILNFKNIFIGKFKTKTIGRHNIINSAVAVVCAFLYSHPLLHIDNINNNLLEYKGVKRRCEVKGNIIHDYAHHPKEILTIIKTIKQFYKKPILVIFEPHTYTRTKKLWNKFLTCFNLADTIIFLPIYAARETPLLNITSKELSKQIPHSIYIKTYLEAQHKILSYINKNDCVVLILGAGDIVKLFDMFS